MNRININTNRFQQIKKFSQFAVLIILLTQASSCKKWLDVKSDSKEEIPSTIKDCQLLLASGYLFQSSPPDGEFSSDDLYLSDGNYGSLQSDQAEIYTWKPEAMHLKYSNVQSWFNPYQAILYTNLAL